MDDQSERGNKFHSLNNILRMKIFDFRRQHLLSPQDAVQREEFIPSFLFDIIPSRVQYPRSLLCYRFCLDPMAVLAATS